MNYIVLTVFLAICLYSAISGKQKYRELKSAKTPKKRIATFKTWLYQSWALFGATATIGLLLLHKMDYLWRPIWHNATADTFSKQFFGDPGTSFGLLGGAVIGILTMGIMSAYAARTKGKQVTIGDFQALLPRSSEEFRWAAALSATAGVTEELFFRAALPLALAAVFGHMVVAILASVIIFSLQHIYQGWQGVLGTLFAGAMLMAIYVLTGNILPGIIFHCLVDLNGLVVQPFIRSKFSKKVVGV